MPNVICLALFVHISIFSAVTDPILTTEYFKFFLHQKSYNPVIIKVKTKSTVIKDNGGREEVSTPIGDRFKTHLKY